MSTIWQKGYNELPSDMYMASIREYPHGGYIFRATPNRGDWVVECIQDDLEDLIHKADRFASGEIHLPGFYTASC